MSRLDGVQHSTRSASAGAAIQLTAEEQRVINQKEILEATVSSILASFHHQHNADRRAVSVDLAIS